MSSKKVSSAVSNDSVVKLRKPQIRILKCLAESKEPLSRKEISELAPVDLAFCTSYIGAVNPEVMERLEKQRGYKSLVSLKYVKRFTVGVNKAEDDKKEFVHEITASGRKALEKVDK